MSEVANLIGLKFDKLTVIERGKNLSNGKATWICVCDCGKRKEKSVTTSDLRSGKVKSCGCLYKESNKNRNKTHHTKVSCRCSESYRFFYHQAPDHKPNLYGEQYMTAEQKKKR